MTLEMPYLFDAYLMLYGTAKATTGKMNPIDFLKS